MLEVLIDNDVVVKCAEYQILGEIVGLGCPSDCAGRSGVLGAARYVAASRLAHRVRSGAIDPMVLELLRDFLVRVEELEPTADEIRLAAEIEEAASQKGVALDAGESQLSAIAILRGVARLLTGDKRAIQGLEAVRETVEKIVQLDGRVVCLEQAMATLVRRLGESVVRGMVCASSTTDRALSICFGCADTGRVFQWTGLHSYVDSLRANAAIILQSDYEFSVH